MAQRFNAPPGWNVPPDFVPTSDWQPDPSWPQAPAGWNFWVDDAAQSVGSYGTPAPTDGAGEGGYGTPSAGAYGADPSPYGTAAPGAFGSTAPGSAQAAVTENHAAGAKRSILIGAGLIALVVVVLFAFDRLFWYFALFGIIMVIKGLVDLNKAKKAEAAQFGYGQGSVPPGFTPPGTTPPGQNPPGY